MHAEIEALRRENTEPTKNLIMALEELYYATGSITRSSQFGKGSPKKRMQRPLAVRSTRAEIFKAVKALSENGGKRNKEKRAKMESLFSEAKQRDSIAEQYLTQKTLSIDLDGLGTQEARVITLALPRETEGKNIERKPPIFFIPGISADVECVGSLAMEMAMQGREVIVVSYPEAFNGKTTDAFVNAVAADPEYGPHTHFFDAALAHLLPEGNIEIWGYSTGAPIAAKILENTDLQKRVTRVVFLCPGGVVNQSLPSLALGAANEARIMADANSAKYMLSIGGKNPDPKNLARRQEITSLLVKRVMRKTTDWSKVCVQDGGQVVFVSGENDWITKSTRAKAEFERNPQAQSAVIEISGGTHLTPFTQPGETLKAIAATEKSR